MGKRILIIDDDKDFCTSVRAVLEGAGYQVSVASNGRQGIERVQTEKPDLVVLDIMMEHDWAGYEVNQAMKFGPDSSLEAIPILMVSSVEVDPHTRFNRATEWGMIQPDSYMTKPLDIPEFVRRVSEMIQKHSGSPQGS
jgi:DNA-binding response OmpR family regulator